MKQNKYKAIPVNPNNMGKNRVKWTDRIYFDIFKKTDQTIII